MPGALFVSRQGKRHWGFLREDGETVEIRTESAADRIRAGHMLRTRVTKILAGIESAFVDLGGGREAFLHARDLWLPGESETAAAGSIEDRLKIGRELLVQIYREPLGDKAPRVTCMLSLPSHDLVYFPRTAARGISRRITDDAERERLAAILDRLDGGDGGFVARTAAAGRSADELERQAAELRARWLGIEQRAERGSVPRWVHDESALLVRFLRDRGSAGLERVVVDDAQDLGLARQTVGEWPGADRVTIQLHQGDAGLLQHEGLDVELRRALRRRIWLRSGGYLVVEPTEALVSIDVNTGKYRGGHLLEETALRVNLEAAPEIARVLRLRDLGGIIAIDFIDMEQETNRQAVLERLRQALSRDPARTNLVGFSALGVVELTRRRSGPGLYTRVSHGCPGCGGRGRVLDEAVEQLLGGDGPPGCPG